MARVTVEDCLTHEENRFSLVVLASQRCRQLARGASSTVPSKNRSAVTALREIAAENVYYNRPVEGAVREYIAEEKAWEVSLLEGGGL